MNSSATPFFSLGPSLLFVPADAPTRYAKAAARSDALIIDLEDAVADTDKEQARAHLAEHLATVLAHDAELAARTVVRINPTGSPHFVLDVALVRDSAVQWVMLPKTESVDDLDLVAKELPGIAILALIETARGVVHATDIAEHPVVGAMMWGAEDLIASIGGFSSRHAETKQYRDVPRFARAQVLIASASAGKLGVDSIYADVHDLDGLRAETEDSVATGWAAKACIHPSHVPVIRDAFRPSEAELDFAQGLLSEATRHGGVFQYRGSMVDGPLVAHARRTVLRASSHKDNEG